MKKKLIILSACLLFSVISSAQEKTDEKGNQATPQLVGEKMPTPTFDIHEYLAKSTHYPDSARKHNIEGRVVIKFVINEDGSISDCQVIKKKNQSSAENTPFYLGQENNNPGFPPNNLTDSVSYEERELDSEAVRVVRDMPKWNPGYQDGKYVKVYFTLPIVFKLTD